MPCYCLLKSQQGDLLLRKEVLMRRKLLGLIASSIAGVVLLASCGPVQASSSEETRPERNTNPKVGWVYVSTDPHGGKVYKRCDGGTLVYAMYEYRRGGLTAIANSPECS